jgi:1,2-phenylacetyl-CoA epoxidase PaaB subunit
MQAVSAVEALRRAREAFADPPGLVWWVVPERSLARTERGDTPELFEGARDKLYRDQSFYFPDMLLRQLRKEQSATRGMPRGRKGGV